MIKPSKPKTTTIAVVRWPNGLTGKAEVHEFTAPTRKEAKRLAREFAKESKKHDR